MKRVTITVNGHTDSHEVEPRLLLVHYIRDVLGPDRHPRRLRHEQLRRVHGSDGRQGREVVHAARGAGGRGLVHDVEGLAKNGDLHPIQEGFWEEHGLQCGFCTPGMMLTAVELLQRNPNPTEAEIRAGLEGNLCRCTGYQHIVNAIQYAAKKMRGESPAKSAR